MEIDGLTVDRQVVKPGDEIVLTPDRSLGDGGVLSLFQEWMDGRWVTRFNLFSPIRGVGEPAWALPESPLSTPSIGIRGPVRVVVPPVPPGHYRIARRFLKRGVGVTAAVELDVEADAAG